MVTAAAGSMPMAEAKRLDEPGTRTPLMPPRRNLNGCHKRASRLPEQHRPTVAERRHELAELVTGIGERQRLGAGRHLGARQHGDSLW